MADEEAGLAAAEALSDAAILRQVWVNERGAPELLPYEAKLVARVREQLASRQALVDAPPQSSDEEFERNLYMQDLERVRYVLASYHRARLFKIERYVTHILAKPEAYERLSEEEKEFATGYLNALEQHLREAFLARLPDKFQSFVSAQEGMVDEPDLDSYVALRVHEDLGPVPISADGEETVELHRSDLLFAPYRPFRALLEQNKVDLV